MSMPEEKQTGRLHALDATRAFALLLGVLLHGAWSFLNPPAGAPVVDVSRNAAFGVLCFITHAFRMPLFFLIAGFFARMLYHGRGLRGFVRNRFTRIAVPLVAGWFILHPITSLIWARDMNVSGQNLTEFTFDLQLKMMFGQGMMFVTPAHGGMFSLDALWFLYYLLGLYALALAARFVLLKLAPAKADLPGKADRLVRFLVRSQWAIACMALPTGLFLWRLDGGTGVDSPNDTLVPDFGILLFYMVFFSFGWLLQRQPEILREFSRRWKPFVTAGLLLAFLLYGAGHWLPAGGAPGGPQGSRYPALWPTHVADWPRFIATLQSAGRSGAPPELANFWKHVPEWDRGPFLSLPPEPDMNVQVGLCRNLNRLLDIPGLFGPDNSPDPRLHNRQRLEYFAAGALKSSSPAIPENTPVNLAKSITYGTIMWLLVCGTLGFFQERFSAPNRVVRYISDSSYWIYLIHLPAILGLQGVVYAWPWPALLKYTLMLTVFFVIAFSSYHILVRPTFIGAVLNGRRYPRAMQNQG